MEKIRFEEFKHESYYLKLKELASTAPRENLAFVFFGGTGAVGGQAVIELIQAFEFIVAVNPQWTLAKPLLIITGRNDEDIKRFQTKLYRAFDSGKHGFEKIENEGGDARLVLSRKTGLRLEIYELNAKPEFTISLEQLIKGKNIEDIKNDLIREASNVTSPFELFLKNYIKQKSLPPGFRFQAVISGIPIPSVAAYHFSAIDKIFESAGLKKIDAEKEFERSVKIKILHGIANDFGKIKNELAHEVFIAHTTSVGGMYNIEGGKPIIRLGYAHSGADEFLLEKQFYAESLTIKYSELGLKVLITAAAIGIDFINTNEVLPFKEEIYSKYKTASGNETLPFPGKLLDKKNNLVFTPALLSAFYPMIDNKGEKAESQKIEFCKDGENSPPALRVGFFLRSGENGLFSIDNAYSLYLNMKIATQEELSHILTFNALFGDDKQKPWFDKNGICYETEGENSILVFALLNNRAEFRAYQTSGFTPKAFQDLGSAKHQCELHTIGLYMLLHKLKTLNPRLISEKITSKYKESEVIEFIDRNTDPLSIETIVNYDPIQKANEFSKLFSINSLDEMARFIGFNGDLKVGFVHSFLLHLLNAVKQTIFTITSLGTPIVYLDNEKVKILSGPFCSPIGSVISHNDTLAKYIKDDSATFNLNQNDYFEWLVANNGFIDLRPQATITTAKTHKNGLKGKIRIVPDLERFRSAIEEIQEDNTRNVSYGYFTSSGTVAFIGRLTGLYEQLKSFDLSLGTLNNWRALFPVDSNMSHPVVPGIIEAMRMYTEGLGKITGFELLYPGFGYFKN